MRRKVFDMVAWGNVAKRSRSGERCSNVVCKTGFRVHWSGLLDEQVRENRQDDEGGRDQSLPVPELRIKIRKGTPLE